MKNIFIIIVMAAVITLLLLVGVSIGAFIATATILGFMSALGAVMIAFKSPILMKILILLNLWVELLVLVFGVLATIFMGVTVAASLVFTGIFFTLFMKIITILAAHSTTFQKAFRPEESLTDKLLVKLPRFKWLEGMYRRK